jgi:hypothetical protein
LATNLPIDIWGNGCDLLQNAQKKDIRIKGPFQESEPYAEYAFHIAIENYQSGHYMSEKLLNALIGGCTPVYWGSHAVHDYFPDSVHELSGNLALDMEMLRRICGDPKHYRKNVDVDAVFQKTDVLREFAATTD